MNTLEALAVGLISTIPLLFWYRFGGIRLDRDWAPYCYPGFFNKGYLQAGHVDIKPPLIHWGFYLWIAFSRMARFSKYMGLERSLRLFPALSHFFAIYGLYAGTGSVLVCLTYALLVSSPQLWNHMANTEWMTSVLLAFLPMATQVSPQFSWALIGLLPLVNVKNLPLGLLVAWVIGLPWQMASYFFLAPIISILILAITSSVKQTVQSVLLEPMRMGKSRNLKTHTNMTLLWGPLWLTAPLIAAVQSQNPWAWVLSAIIALCVVFKQIVPHHVIWLSMPIAASAEAGLFTILAYISVWMTRDFPMWFNPSRTYPLTFFYGNGDHYGLTLNDSKTVEAWIKENTEKDEKIWVNGMENHIYLYAERMATQINIPEFNGQPAEEDLPRVIIHCTRSGDPKFSDELLEKGWEVVEVSKLGLYSIMVKK